MTYYRRLQGKRGHTDTTFVYVVTLLYNIQADSGASGHTDTTCIYVVTLFDNIRETPGQKRAHRYDIY